MSNDNCFDVYSYLPVVRRHVVARAYLRNFTTGGLASGQVTAVSFVGVLSHGTNCMSTPDIQYAE